jgi:hypothetical protein
MVHGSKRKWIEYALRCLGFTQDIYTRKWYLRKELVFSSHRLKSFEMIDAVGSNVTDKIFQLATMFKKLHSENKKLILWKRKFDKSDSDSDWDQIINLDCTVRSIQEDISVLEEDTKVELSSVMSKRVEFSNFEAIMASVDFRFILVNEPGTEKINAWVYECWSGWKREYVVLFINNKYPSQDDIDYEVGGHAWECIIQKDPSWYQQVKHHQEVMAMIMKENDDGDDDDDDDVLLQDGNISEQSAAVANE